MGDFSLSWEIFPTIGYFFYNGRFFSYHGRFFLPWEIFSYHERFFLPWEIFPIMGEILFIKGGKGHKGDFLHQGRLYLPREILFIRYLYWSRQIFIDHGRIILTKADFYWPREIFIDHGRFLLTMGDFYWQREIQFFKKWETVCNFDNQSN